VGVTTRSLHERLGEHLKVARSGRRCSRVQNWIRLLLDAGLVPAIHTVEVVPPGGRWWDAERRWIRAYRYAGVRLTNLTDGGEGVPGAALSLETRAKMSAVAKKRGIPEATREKGRAALRRETRTPEMAAKLKATFVPGMLGKRHSVETKAKMAATHKKFDIGKYPKGANHHQARPVVVDGIRFGSLGEAAEHLGVTNSAIGVRLRTGIAAYATDTGNPEADASAAALNEKAAAAKRARWLNKLRPVVVDGIRFESLKAAAAHCGICPASMIGRIQSGRYKAHYATD
jgi:hypothetical protein